MTSGRLVTRPLGLRSTGSMSQPNLVAITTWSRYGASASPDELLVGVRAVDLGGVEEGDAAVHRGAEQRDHLLPVGLVAVAAGHAHAAQPDGGDLRAVGARVCAAPWLISCRARGNGLGFDGFLRGPRTTLGAGALGWEAPSVPTPGLNSIVSATTSKEETR